MKTRDSASLPRTMRALVLRSKEDFAVETLDVPEPGPGEVLLRVGSVGVCGSDKHMYHEGRASSDVMTGPLIMGHEFGGEIVAAGPLVAGERVGKRVSVEPLMPDWQSREALRGRYNIDPAQRFFGVPGADGALQQYLAVPDRNAFEVPDEVSDDAAAMVETISVALNGISKAAIQIGSTVLIAGAGPVGLFVAQLALLQGAARVACVEPHEGRRRFAAGFGCDVASDLAEVDEEHDAFIDCTGVAQVRHDGFFTVRPGGRVVFIGVGSQDASIPMPAVIEREVTLHGVMRYAFTWPTAIGLLARGRIQADALVSRRLPLSRATEGWTDPLPDEIKTMIRVNE